MDGIDEHLIAEAEQALEKYIQRLRKKGSSVEVERPIYHEGLYNVRCVLRIDGVATRVYYRASLGRWAKSFFK
jgi:hypothetical protein